MNETVIVIVRGLIGFFSLFLFTRILGKQQMSQLTFFDYVLGITIGSIAATLTTALTSRAWLHWVGLATWFLVVLLLQFITLKSRPLTKAIDGEPVVVIMNGQIMEDAMRKARFRISDLLEQLRKKDVFDLSEVEFAGLEIDGQVSVLKKSQYLPVTPHDLGLPTVYKGMSTELIFDGQVVEQNLKQLNLDRAWLDEELKKQGINDPSEVFLALLNTQGNLFIDKYQDGVGKTVDISDYPGPN
ncbi:MAG: DUF421 domain-containing protein [Firmicutes bacterium]|nr:DUF421 domain-containing protein [Bacillota bacterium]